MFDPICKSVTFLDYLILIITRIVCLLEGQIRV